MTNTIHIGHIIIAIGFIGMLTMFGIFLYYDLVTLQSQNIVILITLIILFLCVFGGAKCSEYIETRPTGTLTSHSGEIIDVDVLSTKTIVQFRDGKSLEIYGILTQVHISPNATIRYSESNFGKKYFNNITYEN